VDARTASWQADRGHDRWISHIWDWL